MRPTEYVHFSTIMAIINGIPHGVALFDRQQRIISMNRYLEAVTGYRSDDVTGISGEHILRSNIHAGGDLCKKVLKTGKSISLEGNVINRQRKKIPVQFTISPLPDEQGASTGTLVVMEDISASQAHHTVENSPSTQVGIIGHSPQMKKVFELMTVLARTDASVLLSGETGTGKDLIAEALHKSSPRARYPFIKINCGAIPESLLESELFGHSKGAFTGAVKDKPGMFRLADKGTIFLTEIGDLSPPYKSNCSLYSMTRSSFRLVAVKKFRLMSAL